MSAPIPPVGVATDGRGRQVAAGAALLAGVLLVAANLRPAVVGVGPLLPSIMADTGLSASAGGVLNAVPLLAFGAASVFVPRFAGRVGSERALFVALLVLAGGTIVRSLPSAVALFVGTAVIGLSIAVGNVLLPSLVKRDFPGRVSTVTGLYASVMSLVAAVASAVAVPVAGVAPGGWRTSLAVWSALAVGVAVVWAVVGRRTHRTTPPPTTVRSAPPHTQSATEQRPQPGRVPGQLLQSPESDRMEHGAPLPERPLLERPLPEPPQLERSPTERGAPPEPLEPEPLEPEPVLPPLEPQPPQLEPVPPLPSVPPLSPEPELPPLPPPDKEAAGRRETASPPDARAGQHDGSAAQVTAGSAGSGTSRAGRFASGAVGRTPARIPWRSPLAWQVTAFMGLQSLVFYVVIGWLPSLVQSRGMSAGAGGLLLLLYQGIGVVAYMVTPLLVRRLPDQRFLASGASVVLGGCLVGLLLAPGLVVMWTVLIGAGSGTCMVLALSFFSLRAADPQGAAALSGMGQSVGYLLAAGGPALVGVLHDVTGGWTTPLIVVASLTVVQTCAAHAAGRDRVVRAAV